MPLGKMTDHLPDNTAQRDIRVERERFGLIDLLRYSGWGETLTVDGSMV